MSLRKSRSKNKTICILGSAFALFISIPQLALADPFPGKGDEQTWLNACNVCNQGAQLMQYQRYGEAAKYFEKAIEMYAFDPVFYYDAGLSYQSGAYTMRSADDKKAALEKAESYFAQSAKIKTDKFDTWIHMANVQSELQKYEPSLKSLQTALAIPGVPETEKQKAKLAIEFVKTKLAQSRQQNIESEQNTLANASAPQIHLAGNRTIQASLKCVIPMAGKSLRMQTPDKSIFHTQAVQCFQYCHFLQLK